MRGLLRGVLLSAAVSATAAAGESAIHRGDYTLELTGHGVEASWRGTPFLCGSHVHINKPGWTGLWYAGRNLPAKATAKIVVAADRVTVTDVAPDIDGQVLQEFQLDDGGLVVSLTVKIGKEIPTGPVEYAAAILPSERFAGGRLRPRGLLGAGDWEALPADKPVETGPGTLLLRQGVTGLDLAGLGVTVSVEPEQGHPFNFFDMRSRDYPVAERHYWVLYQWEAQRGEYRVRTRFRAGPGTDAGANQEGKMVFIAEGEKQIPVRAIVVAAAASPLEQAAARELQTNLSKIGGATVPIVARATGEQAERGLILVGRGAAAEFEDGSTVEHGLAALGWDGFVLRVRGSRVLAAGRNERGTTYAVYRLLELLGCRFYARELEVIPTLSPLLIRGPLEVKDSAAFEWRAMSGTIAPMKCGLSPGEWEAQVAGVDVPKMMAWPKGGFWHHTMGYLLPAAPLAEEHPEYLALLDGQRRVVEPAVQQYCLSNPALLQAMTAAVLAWIESDPDKLYYPVHYGDVGKFCECDTCKAMYAAQGSITDTVIGFDNQIAKAVAAKFPGKFVTILAYHSTRQAPRTIRPEPNLLIVFCAIVECQARPWTAPVNLKRNVCRDLEDWARLHPLGGQGLMSFDYPTTYHYAGIAFPALYAYAENLRLYRKVGLRGAYVCGLGSWKHLEHLYSYVMPRLLWQPEQDLGRLIDEFCQAWYGPAAAPMREYVELLHRSAMASQSEGVMDCHAGPGQAFFRELLTPTFCERAYGLFQAAEALADNELVRNRIAKEKWGLLVPDLFLHGSHQGNLVPAAGEVGYETEAPSSEQYRKVAELLRLNRLFSRPWDINRTRWNRYSLSALTGIEPDRQPWWESPALLALMTDPEGTRAGVLAAARQRLQGLVTLENPVLKVVLVPQLGGRIWRLYHKGTRQDLLWRGPIPMWGLGKGLDPASYTNLGGYEEYVGEKFGGPGWAENYRSRPAPDGRRVTLSADLPGGLRLTRTVTLAEDAAELTVETRLDNTADHELPGVVLRVHPQFALRAGDAADVRVRGQDGTWRPLPSSADEAFLRADERPAGAWAVHFRQAGLQVVNTFARDQVGTCLLYRGAEFLNLELFSAPQTLAPGAGLTLRHRYTVEAVQ